MGSNKKRKRGNEPRSIHPRNKYADNPPDFSLLASLYPSFAAYVFNSHNGRPRIDWTDFNATRELSRVLLLHDHSINWWIPDGQLCPTVPNRLNYIHWIEDLLATDVVEKNRVNGDKVRGFDIGTGANCIYPLLGASLLGWNFVGSDVTDIALEWANKNVISNPHLSDLIEIRRVNVVGSPSGAIAAEVTDRKGVAYAQMNKVSMDSITPDMRELDEAAVATSYDNLELLQREEASEFNNSREIVSQLESFSPVSVNLNVDRDYHGPVILVGVVRDGEKFDFCMCNPPFFESMVEAGLNPKTSCGGTIEEMVYPGGERAFISRIIEDSVVLKQSFRWYTSMIGKKSNLKYLVSKLREVGVTVLKTTEFVQGQTCRWGLAWSFMPAAKRFVPSCGSEKTQLSFMLEGLQRKTSAFTVLQSIESFFSLLGASCNTNVSSFSVDVNATKDQCDAILKNNVKGLDESSSFKRVANTSEEASLATQLMKLSFRIAVFQQIPGSLLVKGSLQQRGCPLSGSFAPVFQQLEEFAKHKFGKQKTLVGPVY